MEAKGSDLPAMLPTLARLSVSVTSPSVSVLLPPPTTSPSAHVTNRELTSVDRILLVRRPDSFQTSSWADVRAYLSDRRPPETALSSQSAPSSSQTHRWYWLRVASRTSCQPSLSANAPTPSGISWASWRGLLRSPRTYFQTSPASSAYHGLPRW